MISNKILKINDRDGAIGYYGKSKNGVFVDIYKGTIVDNLEECRDEIRYYLDKNLKFIGFYKTNLNLIKLNQFFNLIETKLKLKQKSIFYKSNIEDLIIMEISPFWSKCVIKRDFLTLFLRCGAVYYKTSLNQAFNDYDLTKKIKPTINFFLDGNTDPNYSPLMDWYDFEDNFSGVCDCFKGNKDLNRKLFKK
jgi:hypothetical protein